MRLCVLHDTHDPLCIDDGWMNEYGNYRFCMPTENREHNYSFSRMRFNANEQFSRHIDMPGS